MTSDGQLQFQSSSIVFCNKTKPLLLCIIIDTKIWRDSPSFKHGEGREGMEKNFQSSFKNYCQPSILK